MSARILVLDIETSPNLAYVWDLWKQNVALSQIRNVGQVISFAAKWHGEKGVMFHSDFNFDTGELNGHGSMIRAAHELLDEADAVVHWNGTSFDIPHLYREILLTIPTWGPPAPHKDVDLMLAVRKRFRFASNKLDHVAQQLGVGAKLAHSGFSLWRRCLDGDVKAWRTMRRYNMRDVEITDRVYSILKPWVPSHPHLGLYTDDAGVNICGRCGSDRLQRRGFATTSVSRFQRYQCVSCGGWSRVARRDVGVDLRPTG